MFETIERPSVGKPMRAAWGARLVDRVNELCAATSPGMLSREGVFGSFSEPIPLNRRVPRGYSTIYPWKVSLVTDDSGSQVLTVYLPYGSLVSDGKVIDIEDIEGKLQIETEDGVAADLFAVDLNGVSDGEGSRGVYLDTKRDAENNIKFVLAVREIEESDGAEESDADKEDMKDSSVLIATLKQTEDDEGNKLLQIDKQIVFGALVLYTKNITEGCFAIDKQWKLINTYFRIGTLITEIQFDYELTAGVWCIKILSRIDPDDPSPAEPPRIIRLDSIQQLMTEQNDPDYVFIPLYVIEEKDDVKFVELDMRSIPTAPMWEV